jgi:uncharacterized protein YndB with AHSA1/START domain
VPEECSVRLTRRYAAAPADVWEALVDPESVVRWLGHPLGTIVREEPPHLLELDWRTDEERASVVRFELTEVAGGTVLVIDHTGIAAPRGMAAIGFWKRSVDHLPVEAR